jgi:hypothetical protein
MRPETNEWGQGTYLVGLAILSLLGAILLAFLSSWTAAVVLIVFAAMSLFWGLRYLRADDD